MSGSNRIVTLLLVVLDVIVFYGSYYVAFFFFNGFHDLANVELFVHLSAWLGAGSILVFYFFDLYSSRLLQKKSELVQTVLFAICFLTLVIMTMSFWIRDFSIPRSLILTGACINCVLMINARVIIRILSEKAAGLKRVIILTNHPEEDKERLRQKLTKYSRNFSVVDLYKPAHAHDLIHCSEKADVFLLSDSVSREDKEQILRLSLFRDKEVFLMPDLYELMIAGANVQPIDDDMLVAIKMPQMSVAKRFWKRTFDCVISLLLLFITSPILLILFILIPVTSKGPAIYSQERLGQNGKPFLLYKFRSMIQNAEDHSGPILAGERDPRITKMGKWMRAMRLDELPQLLNVLTGSMSMVGPRPERAYFVYKYQERIPEFSFRMKVKPGITGLAQVMGNYGTGPEEKLRYDLMYIKSYSMVLDIKILFQTLLVVFKWRKAKGIREEESKGSTNRTADTIQAVDLSYGKEEKAL